MTFTRFVASLIALAALVLVATTPRGTTAVADDGTFSPAQKEAIGRIVKDYLLANPEVMIEVQTALEARMEKLQAEKVKAGITQFSADIYRRPTAPVAGNASGDITVTEFFDYNCGYCKKSLPDIAGLIKADPKVRVVLKELPILSQDSLDASKIALAAKLQGKYWEVHTGLLEAKGRATGASALKIAERLGLDVERLKKDAEGPEVKAELDAAREIATKMGINGTPHFLVGDRSIAGAPNDLQAMLTSHIADLRKTGCTFC
jgi:protein-disulfide isomerase